MWDPSRHRGNLGQNALFHSKHPITTHNQSNSSHFGMQRWLWREGKYNNRNERKSADSQLRCSPADNTHPTLKPWGRGEAWLRSGRLIPTNYDKYLNKVAENGNITVELACAKSNWTREEAEKAMVGSHYLLAVLIKLLQIIDSPHQA